MERWKKEWIVTSEKLFSQGYIEKFNPMKTRYFEDEAGSIVAKICRDCAHIIKTIGFDKNKRGLGGLRSACKFCVSEYHHNKRLTSPEEYRENARRYYESNLEKERERRREYYKNNLNKVLKRNRNYYAENSIAVNERIRKYTENNPEKVRERRRKYYENNYEKVLEKNRNYYRDNPEKRKINTHLRRARKAALPNTLTLKQWTSVVYRFGGGCSLTGSKDYVREHAIPIAIGHGGTTIENMTPMRADLNASKSDRHIFEWFDANKERFNLSQRKFDELIEYLAQVNEMTTQEYRAYVDWCFDNPRDINAMEATG